MTRLFIADADDYFCDLYKIFFSARDYEVETAGSALECWARLRRAVPDLLILDLHLPWGGADGILEVLREDPRLGRLPVFLTYERASPAALADLAVPPVVRAIAKPFSLLSLLDLVAFEMTKKGKRPKGDWPAAEPRRCGLELIGKEG